MEDENYFTRSRSLLGEERFTKLENMRFCIIGLGGVGGSAFEALVRSGAKHIVGIDFDKVSPSNLNRQILFTRFDIGKYKADCAFVRAKSINEEVDVETLRIKINEDNLSFLDHYDFDYVIDAIDDLNAKVLLIKYLLRRNIPFISSLGMGNRIDCSSIEITKINKTHDDPLARKLRYLLKQEGIDLSQVNVIFSSSKVEETNVDFVSSIMPSPSCAGLSAVAYILKNL
ncbi:MAG: ThiF family adenylyltransferase [Bacilli bacterium]